MTKLTQKIENLENYYCQIKRELNLHQNTKDILLDIEDLLDEDYIPSVIDQINNGGWEGYFKSFSRGCFDTIKEIEMIIELLPKKNQQKYEKEVKDLWSLHDEMVKEGERCKTEEEEEEEEELYWLEYQLEVY